MKIRDLIHHPAERPKRKEERSNGRHRRVHSQHSVHEQPYPHRRHPVSHSSSSPTAVPPHVFETHSPSSHLSPRNQSYTLPYHSGLPHSAQSNYTFVAQPTPQHHASPSSLATASPTLKHQRVNEAYPSPAPSVAPRSGIATQEHADVRWQTLGEPVMYRRGEPSNVADREPAVDHSQAHGRSKNGRDPHNKPRNIKQRRNRVVKRDLFKNLEDAVQGTGFDGWGEGDKHNGGNGHDERRKYNADAIIQAATSQLVMCQRLLLTVPLDDENDRRRLGPWAEAAWQQQRRLKMLIASGEVRL